MYSLSANLEDTGTVVPNHYIYQIGREYIKLSKE